MALVEGGNAKQAEIVTKKHIKSALDAIDAFS